MLKTCKPLRSYEFGPFRLDITKRLLSREGRPVHLPPKAFDTLLVLVENHGRVVEKSELLNQVWPDSYVEEINLTVYISMLRKILGDCPDEHQYIVTSPRRGYSFVASVIEVWDDEAAPADHPQPATSEPIRTPGLEPTPGAGESDSRPPEQEAAKEAEKGAAASTATVIHRYTLRYKITALSLMVIAILLALSWHFIFGKRQPGPSRRSVAVLPFRLLGSPDDANLEVGMADALITRLSRLDQIVVRPSSAIFTYAGKAYDPVAAGVKLNVDAVMTGTIQQTNERIRVSVQLINVADGRPLWADRFDEERINIFSMQDSISEQVAHALTLKLNDQDIKRLAEHHTENPEAYRAYSRGMYFWSERTNAGLQKSIEYFQQAINKDPNYALAYAGIADSEGLLAHSSDDAQAREECLARGKAAALKAIEMDETVAEAHTALAMIEFTSGQDSNTTEKEYQRALELNPNYATGHQRYAWYLLARGQLSRAAQEMRLAAELDPISKINNAAWANLLYFLGEHDQAIEQCLKVLELDPNDGPARYLLSLAYEQTKQYEQAIATLQKYDETNKGDPMYYGELGRVYALSGRTAEAHKMLRELERLNRKEDSTLYCMALVYMGLGDMDRAFAWLNRGARAGVTSFWFRFRYDPRFATIRNDPRYTNFLHLLGEALANRR